MPVLSYLIFPSPGKKEALEKELSALPNCDLIPAENKDLFILVTESSSKSEDENFREKMDAIPSLLGFSLVAGIDDDSTQIEE